MNKKKPKRGGAGTPALPGGAAVALGVSVVPVKRIAVKRIKAAKYNPRKDLQPSDPEYRALKRSIETFGYVDPLIFNKRSGNLVGGHQRLKVLMHEFGVTELDVAVVDLPPAEEKALNVALNNIAGEWDDSGLSAVLAELADSSIDETVTGFDPDQLEAMFAGLQVGETEDATQPTVEHSFRVVATCRNAREQKRVLTLLGKHKIACHTLTR